MLFKSVVKAAIVATALAQPVQHQHHQHDKKDVITQTVYVTQGGEKLVTASPGTDNHPAPTTVSTSVSTGSSIPSSGPSSAPSGSFAAPVKGITYSPYADDGSCKSKSQVELDVKALSSYEIIRLYGVDCNQVENVLAAMSPEQKLFAGIFFMDRIAQDVATLAAAVKAANGWGQVHTVSIGNELVNSKQATASQVKGYVETGRAALAAAGYTGDVVTVDTFIAIYENKELCDVSPYIAANAHAYFDGNVAAADAGTWVAQQYQGLINTCPGKKVLIVESGWPSQGDTNGKAVAGSSEQASALKSIAEKASDYTFYFNAYNDMWKNPGYLKCENYWGVLN